jgi:hypothetical protein
MAFVVVPHPLGMISAEEVYAKTDAAFPDILEAATQWKPERTTIPGLGDSPYPLEVIEFEGTVEEMTDMFFENAWSIGIPFIPPTVDAVQEMLTGTSHAPDEIVWEAVPPRMGVATVELVAVNGVMAGCKPEHMPLLLAVVEAMQTQPSGGFDWRGWTTTTHPGAPYFIVSGPIVEELDIGFSTGAMGPEMPVNMCVGYFVNLLGDVAGGSRPPDVDKTTQAWQAHTLATVAGENVEGDPWGESLAVERGYAPTDNILFFGNGSPPLIQNDHASVDPLDLAEVMAYTMNCVGASRCFGRGGTWVLGPEHADTLADGGWSKDDFRQFLWETARAPFWSMPPLAAGKCAVSSCCPESFPEDFGPVTDDTMIPAVLSPEVIDVVVIGGPGKQSEYWPTQLTIEVEIDPWR